MHVIHHVLSRNTLTGIFLKLCLHHVSKCKDKGEQSYKIIFSNPPPTCELHANRLYRTCSWTHPRSRTESHSVFTQLTIFFSHSSSWGPVMTRYLSFRPQSWHWYSLPGHSDETSSSNSFLKYLIMASFASLHHLGHGVIVKSHLVT